jgi:hypothetical protein
LVTVKSNWWSFPLSRPLVIPGEVEESLVMEEQGDKEIACKKQRDQMLKLVTKGFTQLSPRHSMTIASKL